MGSGVIESLGVLILRVVIALMAVAIAAPEMAFAKEETPDYFATHSKLNDQNVRNLLSQERCYSQENAFLGCIAALNTLLANADSSLQLTNAQNQNQPALKEVIKQIGSLSLRKIDQNFKPDSKKTRVQLAKEADALRKSSNKSWKTVFAQTKNNQISIENLLDEALSQKISKRRGQVLAASINAYLNNTIDPHTNIWSEKGMDEMMNTKEDRWSGIGAYLALTPELKIEMQPLEGSPSLAAGVRKKDILTHIEGEAVQLANSDEFEKLTDKLKGKENTVVNVTVLRNGKSLNLQITRGAIAIKNLEGKILVNSKTQQKIAHIRLRSFMQNNLCREFVSLARDLYHQGAESLILDVRNNGGGDLNAVLCMSAAYIDSGLPILLYQNPETNEVERVVNNGLPFLNLNYNIMNAFTPRAAELYRLYKKPLVILMNEASASASELLPGALQAYRRVVTVGVRSYGKGTVQSGTRDVQSVGLEEIEGVLLMKTVARFHFADGSTNQLVGISSDFTVYNNPVPTEEDLYAIREADQYPNAISAGIQKPKGISATRKTEISNCLPQNSDIAGEYARDEQSALGGDYQLITAKAVASCL